MSPTALPTNETAVKIKDIIDAVQHIPYHRECLEHYTTHRAFMTEYAHAKEFENALKQRCNSLIDEDLASYDNFDPVEKVAKLFEYDNRFINIYADVIPPYVDVDYIMRKVDDAVKTCCEYIIDDLHHIEQSVDFKHIVYVLNGFPEKYDRAKITCMSKMVDRIRQIVDADKTAYRVPVLCEFLSTGGQFDDIDGAVQYATETLQQYKEARSADAEARSAARSAEAAQRMDAQNVAHALMLTSMMAARRPTGRVPGAGEDGARPHLNLPRPDNSMFYKMGGYYIDH